MAVRRRARALSSQSGSPTKRRRSSMARRAFGYWHAPPLQTAFGSQQSVAIPHPVSLSLTHPQRPSPVEHRPVQHSLSVEHADRSGVHVPESEPASGGGLLPQNVVAHCVPQSPHVHEYHAAHSLIASDEAELPQLLMQFEETEPQPLTHPFSATQLESAAHNFSFVAQSLADDVPRHDWHVCGTVGFAPIAGPASAPASADGFPPFEHATALVTTKAIAAAAQAFQALI